MGTILTDVHAIKFQQQVRELSARHAGASHKKSVKVL